MSEYICLDIGGTAIKHGIMGESLSFFSRGHVDTDAGRGGEAVLATAIDIVRGYLDACEPAGICISTAGMVDVDKGVIFHSGPQIPDYTGMPVKARMEEIFALPCEVENDVNCAGLAEALAGAAKGAASCLCLTVGTGIGGCLVLDGAVYHGFSGSACEIGYMHMHGASFQELASSTAVLQRVKKRRGKAIDGRELFVLARQGDAVCTEEIEKMAEYLAEGVANLVYALNPEMVVLGGGIMNETDYLAPLLNRQLERLLIPVVRRSTALGFARFGNNAGMIGAYYHFQQMREQRRQL